MHFTLELFSAKPAGGAKLAQYFLDTDVNGLTFSTSIPGGFNGMDITFVDPGIAEYGITPTDAWVNGFIHAELRQGQKLAYAGRIMRIIETGAAVTSISCQGYGVSATKDNWWNGGGITGTSSGAALRAALIQCSPMIGIGGQDLFIDPGVIHKATDFKYNTPAQIIDTISKEGGSDGRLYDFRVYDGEVAILRPRVFDRALDVLYQVDLDHSVTRERTFEECYGAVSALTSATSLPSLPAQNPNFFDTFGVSRSLLVNVPSYLNTYLGWQFAQTTLLQKGGPQIAYTIRRAKDQAALAFPSGGLQAVHNVRAGDWVQVGDSPPVMILQTTYNVSTGDWEAHASGFPVEYFYRYIAAKTLANHYLNGTNPVTGLRV